MYIYIYRERERDAKASRTNRSLGILQAEQSLGCGLSVAALLLIRPFVRCGLCREPDTRTGK